MTLYRRPSIPKADSRSRRALFSHLWMWWYVRSGLGLLICKYSVSILITCFHGRRRIFHQKTVWIGFFSSLLGQSETLWHFKTSDSEPTPTQVSFQISGAPFLTSPPVCLIHPPRRLPRLPLSMRRQTSQTCSVNCFKIYSLLQICNSWRAGECM